MSRTDKRQELRGSMERRDFEKFASMIRSPKFCVIWLVFMMISYFFFDQTIAEYFQPHLGWLYDVSTWVTPFGYPKVYLVICLILAFLGYVVFKKRELTQNALFVLTGLVVTAIIQNLLKVLLGRARPEMLFDYGKFGFYFFQTSNNMWSVPSGLITTMTAIFIALCYLFPRYWLSWITILALASLTRVVVTVHYFSDVMASLYLMTMVMIWLADRFKNRSLIREN